VYNKANNIINRMKCLLLRATLRKWKRCGRSAVVNRKQTALDEEVYIKYNNQLLNHPNRCYSGYHMMIMLLMLPLHLRPGTIVERIRREALQINDDWHVLTRGCGADVGDHPVRGIAQLQTPPSVEYTPISTSSQAMDGDGRRSRTEIGLPIEDAL